MAKILLTWELGAGLGHLTRLRSLVKYLAAQSHEIHLAVRTLASVDTVFADQDLYLYQAPITHGKSPTHIHQPVAFSHILHNCGWRWKNWSPITCHCVVCETSSNWKDHRHCRPIRRAWMPSWPP